METLNRAQEDQFEVQTEKTYVTSKKKWTDFDLHPQIIEVLKVNKMNKPTRVQEETLPISANMQRKKFNLLIRSSNGSGKTLCYLLPILNSLKSGVVTTKDKIVDYKTYKNEVFMPQAIIFVQTGLLAQQIQFILKQIRSTANKISQLQNKKTSLLNFTIGSMNNDGHKPGDIIISVIKSFLNRHERRNISLENCNFVALDQVDEIYENGEAELEKVLRIVEHSSKTKLISCSATMKKQFMHFYYRIIPRTMPNSLQVNINDMLRKELGYNISLEGVSNYVLATKSSSPDERHNFILNQVFKELYQNTFKQKPKVFIFFNSIAQIQKFKQSFDHAVENKKKQPQNYLQDLNVGIIAAKRRINGQDKQLSHQERGAILTKFRNGDYNILLSTNIIARGIDIRNVCFVINCDAPRDKHEGEISIDTYLHRVGRTGRYSDKGVALTIVPTEVDKKKLISSVESVHKVQIKQSLPIKELRCEIQKCVCFNTNTSFKEF